MEITHGTEKTLKIHDMYEIPLDTLITNHALNGGNLIWVDGVVFSFAGFQVIDKIVLEQLKGHYEWVLLEYNMNLKEYSPTLRADQLNREIAVFNMSFHPFYKKIADYIRKNHEVQKG